MEKIRQHYFFDGRVQGVGFRYRAEHLALMLGLTGWIRNLEDGRVEMELQGSKEAVMAMIAGLYKGTYICITDIEVKDMTLQEESSFRVRG